MNKLIQVYDAGDSYTIATRLHLSYQISKLEIDKAKADIIAEAVAKLTADIDRAIKAASKQVGPEIARLRKEAEDKAKVAA